MESFKQRWQVFLSIVFDPWTLCFLISTALLLYKSLTQNNPSVSTTTLFTILITLSSAVLGGRVSKQWIDATEGGILIARGKSAVRSLKLLLSTIISMDKRIDRYLSHDDIKRSDVAKLSLEEVKERCNLLAEESVSSIENWTDIIPEADVKTHIGIISDLKFEFESTAKDLQALKTELSQTKNKSKEEQKKLEEAVQDKDKELLKLQREMRKKETNFGIGLDPSGGSYVTLSGITSSISPSFKVDAKGNIIYEPTSFIINSSEGADFPSQDMVENDDDDKEK
jgi:hypothetical protein